MSVSALDAKVQAAGLLARGVSTDKVGEALGIDGRTVRRWRSDDPEFRADIQAARQAILSETATALGAAARDAVNVLCAALADDNPSIRVRAALGLLSALPVVSEHIELAERIAQIEAAAKAGAA